MAMPQRPSSNPRADALRHRTKQLAIEVVRLVRTLPQGAEARVLGTQLLRSATSVGSNYRAVCRARSRREFIAKLGIVIEEADETLFWLELLEELGLVDHQRVSAQMSEADALLSIFVVARITARRQR